MKGRGEVSRLHVTRLRVLGRGWGRFKTEDVTVMVDPEVEQGDIRSAAEPTQIRSAMELIEILDLDDEDAETGLPYGREWPN